MTNREKLNSMTDTEFANQLCYLMELAADKADVDQCDICPVTKLCKRGCAGFITWLNQEAKDE